MNNKIKFTAIGLCALGMSSCMTMENSTSRNLVYPAYPSYDNRQFYNQSNLNMVDYSDNVNYKESERPQQNVVVPNSYHVGEMHSPVSFRDRDQAWVNAQNPQAYTIELAESNKASHVARTLYNAPKTDRRAQIKYQQGGKEYYRGVYGSYNSAEEAQKALEALPSDLKGGASVKNWGSVQ